ncbi:MAG: hypothetical protein LBC43_04030 [Bifidobacteriaceae bacterium]|jgi:hypothetical protein|nr:hypothetical protein [Bifidobacteriaceae bacterium]
MPTTVPAQPHSALELGEDPSSLVVEFGKHKTPVVKKYVPKPDKYEIEEENEKPELTPEFLKTHPNYRSVDDLTEAEIQAHSSPAGHWSFDEYEGRFIRPEIVEEMMETGRLIDEGRYDELGLSLVFDNADDFLANLMAEINES